jgi:ribosome-associated heat shock protein Hsp15
MRIDKLIWALRLYKTRSLAAKACAKEQVKLNGSLVKSAKLTQSGDEISVKTIPIWRSFKVLDIPKSRIGAKLLPVYLIETTDQDDLTQLEKVQQVNRQNKLLGIKGRPTKKVRRNLDKLN